MADEKIRLSVGAAPGQRAFAAVAGVLCTAFGAVFVLLPIFAGPLLSRLTGYGDPFPSYDEARDLPPGMLPPALNDPASPGSFRFVGLCGLPFVLLGLYLLLRVLRTAAWLEGTRASVRGALGTRTVDLATAEVRGGALAYRGGDDAVLRVPTVIARDRDTGRRVTIPLQGMGLATLPSNELRALADAITTGRPNEGRDADVHVLAGRLRDMAGDPLGR
ncbi:hypothetical protein ONA91_09680 [Micromonospora sp. DR5-3]|uniref:hypothetical protein n=1 Tax=unclassified Micromonospora TaxID=2617518 RepID=UPI0011D47E67|nr:MULTISPECIES: hypothetical protein [unclassified Micromonospora]MCW3814724.1 hypothetical protein [Micromonospora sp. DR5-3]TYC23512.1 hypothetical protein FXF52_15125 [Micromonospora sp. MP36]